RIPPPPIPTVEIVRPNQQTQVQRFREELKPVTPSIPRDQSIPIPVPLPEDQTKVIRDDWNLGDTALVSDGKERASGEPDVTPTSGGDVLPRFGEVVFVEELPDPVKKVEPEYTEIAK